MAKSNSKKIKLTVVQSDDGVVQNDLVSDSKPVSNNNKRTKIQISEPENESSDKGIENSEISTEKSKNNNIAKSDVRGDELEVQNDENEANAVNNTASEISETKTESKSQINEINVESSDENSDDESTSESENTTAPDDVQEELPTESQSIVVEEQESPQQTIDVTNDQDFDEDSDSKSPSDDNTDDLVDQIIAEESDQVLQAEDQQLEQVNQEPKTSFGQKIKAAWGLWWLNPWTKWLSILLILAGLGGLAAWPTSRYWTLNQFGVRSSASLIVIDGASFQPIKNARVSLANQTILSDQEGHVEFKNLKLGHGQLLIEKLAYTSLDRPVTVGWGNNPFGQFSLIPSGQVYSFETVDWLSGKPIPKSEAVFGQSNARGDEKGLIKLALDSPGEKFEVTIKLAGYRDEVVSLKTADISRVLKVKLVPSRPHLFVSKKSGKYDVYRIDVDAKNAKMLLAGTGYERDDMVLTTHPKLLMAAVVSSRENIANADGFRLSILTLIDLNNDTPIKIAQSERIQLVDWFENRLVYVQIAAGASAANPRRYRLMSYDIDKKSSKELAASNYFNDVLAANGKIYFAPSSIYGGGTTPGFYSVNPDGTNLQAIITNETWNIFRSSYDHLVISVQQNWYDFKIGGGQPQKLDGAPIILVSRQYQTSPSGKFHLWHDKRDGKGVIIKFDQTNGKDEIVRSQSSLNPPLFWLNENTVIFRIVSDQETADYVFSLEGGEARKITDVTDTSSLERWYYY